MTTDGASVLENIEPLVVGDPGDDDLRRRYLAAAESLGRHLHAAEALEQALELVTDPSVRERVGFDVAMLYLGEGELPRARSAFLRVVRANAGGPAAISAARRLLDLQVGHTDPETVGPALDLLASVIDSPAPADARHDVAPPAVAQPEVSPAFEAHAASETSDVHPEIAPPSEKPPVIFSPAPVPAEVRHETTLRKAQALGRDGRGAEALQLCRELFVEPDLDPTIVERIAEIAHDEDDTALYRHALEFLAQVGPPETRTRALERLGDFQFEHLGDRQAAAASWRPAAQVYDGTPGETDHARHLYERVLEALPEDRDAAERLTGLYRQSNEWRKLPDVIRVLVRTDPEFGAKSILDLERAAIEAAEVDEFVSLVGEVFDRIPEASPIRSQLKQARARALGTDATRQAEASRAYREIIESSGSEDDVRAFEAFVESRSSAEERHRERRWLYEWRVTHGPRPESVLFDWARAEEELGDAEAAIAVYDRLCKAAPTRRDALEAVCRLKLQASDFEGGLAALRALRDGGTKAEQRSLTLRMARLLLDDLGQPAEAALALMPLLDAVPSVREAHDMMARTLSDPANSAEVAQRLEQLADGEKNGAVAKRVFLFLVQAREGTAKLTEARRRWFQRLVDLSLPDPDAAMSAAIQGVTELPDSMQLWDLAERLGRELDRRETVADAYHHALVDSAPEPALADALGHRMVAFADEYGADPSRLVRTLQAILALSPGNRWALDRVKLALGAQARWDELFGLYDRAIEATSGPGREELLHEAACAAKDLAGLPERAIPYLEEIHRSRPGDVSAATSLERLYERQGRTRSLVLLLEERLEKSAGFKRFETFGRIASLLLDLADVEPAFRVVERMIGEGAAVADVTGLLERISSTGAAGDRLESPDDPDTVAPTQRSAIARLRKHYEDSGQADNVVRMALRQLELADRPELRARCVRDLVDVRLAAARGKPEPFDRATSDIESDVAGHPALAMTAFEALLKRALRAWHRTPDDADARNAAWRAIGALKALLVEAKRPRRTVGMLYRCSRLPFERRAQRQLLRASAMECAKGLQDRERAIRIFAELFAQEGGDEVAAQSVGDYAALLDATGRHEALATMWEQQSRFHANAGNPSEQRACWERAATLWERQGALPKAIAAYRQAAALSSEASFEALAKIYESRGDWEQAAGALEWLYAQAPAQKRGLRALRLAEAYTALDDRDRAKERLERAIQAGIETERAAQVSEFLVALYRRDSAWRPLAVRLAADADRATDPEKKLALLREASELLRDKLDAPAEAAALLEKALALAPRDGSIRLALADQLEALERWDRLVEVLRDPVALDADASSKQRAFSHHRLARALALAGRHDDSLAELRIAAELFPTHATILHHLARAALEGGALDLAESTNRGLLLALHHTTESLGHGSPRRADVFLDLSEIAVRNGDMRRAADLVDSAVEADLDANEDSRPIEATLAARGRYDLLARAIERRFDRATTLAQRACALGDLVVVWSTHLGRSQEVRARISHHADGLRRELEREDSADAATWTAAAGVFASIGEEEARAAIHRRRVTVLKTAVGAAKVGADRSRLRVHLAKALLEESDETDGAISALAAAIDEDPNHSEAADVLSEVLERRGRLDERVVLFEKRVAALRPDSPGFVDASWRLGRALESAGRKDDALRIYEGLADRVPSDGAAIESLVDRLESFGSGRAGDALERWIVGGHRASDAVRRLVEHRERRGTPDQLRRALELGLSIDPGDVALALRTADFHRSAGNPREAIRALGFALAARPRDSRLLSLRAALREASGDPDGALSDLEVASASDAGCLDALVALHGRLDSQSVAPIAAAHTVQLVDLLIGANRAADARREVDRLLTRNPNYAGALERLASLSAAAKEWDLAIEAYRKLFAIAEKGDVEQVARIVPAMAETCELAERPGDARETIERALTLLPDDAELLKWLGRVYELSGEWALLVKLWTSRAQKEDRPAARAELFVRAASALFENGGERSDALRLADMARAADPENMGAALLWAQVKLANGCAPEALAVLRHASERNHGKRSPFGARISLETAKAHLALDELPEALEHLKAAFAAESRNTAIALLLGLVAVDLDDERTAERAMLAVTGTASRTVEERRAHACAFFHLALLARAKNDSARARRLAGKALALQPDHADASILVEQLGSAAGATLAAQPAAPRAAVSPRS
jgi:tetratricopeptide (TPR) repeat protein